MVTILTDKRDNENEYPVDKHPAAQLFLQKFSDFVCSVTAFSKK